MWIRSPLDSNCAGWKSTRSRATVAYLSGTQNSPNHIAANRSAVDQLGVLGQWSSSRRFSPTSVMDITCNQQLVGLLIDSNSHGQSASRCSCRRGGCRNCFARHQVAIWGPGLVSVSKPYLGTYIPSSRRSNSTQGNRGLLPCRHRRGTVIYLRVACTAP